MCNNFVSFNFNCRNHSDTCLSALEHEEFNEIDDLFNEKEYNNPMYAAAVNTSRIAKTFENEENIVSWNFYCIF